jgi:EmrB/QacA subfamily drug resistance transporter
VAAAPEVAVEPRVTSPPMKRWGALVILAAAQFLMVLDQSVMNVSISQLVKDFDTDVTVIQGVITAYSLVMAALMITGGKIGDLVGRRRAFTVGLIIYACGSALTAASWSVGALLLGWSILEGIGAALVLPALAALIAGNYEGTQRALAYAVIGGVAGAGIAVGPILGGWVTTEYSWRYVFVGEVVVSALIVAFVKLLSDAARPGRAPQLDWVGSILSASGLGLVVLGVLSASTWGWVAPKNSPLEPFGFSLTPFVVGAGCGVLWGFRAWQRHREDSGLDPLVHFALLRIASLRSGLSSFLSQNLVLMGIFFVVPLYLQLVLGLDAFETGVRMLPVSITMFIVALAGSRLALRFAPRPLVRVGFVVLLAGDLLLLATVDPTLDNVGFAVAMGVLGIGLGLLASQLGNVVQSSVGPEDRSEAGGLQYTAQQLGSALGVALIGAIVLTGLAQSFVNRVADDDRIADEVSQQVSVHVSKGVSFVSADQVEAAATDAGVDQATTTALVDDYEDAQIQALKAGLLVVAGIVLASLLTTRGLPAQVAGGTQEEVEAVDR